jgi:DNA (cytosine-5)-methyltransferase 1
MVEASSNGRNGHNAPAKTFCEFFAGIGLVHEGLRKSGWQCVYANDIDPKKREMYEAHFGRSEHFHLGDVWKADEVVGRIPGRPFLATASFPCIDLSLAGHYRGLGGEHSSTFFGFTRVLEDLGARRPRAVMLENVTGFLSSRGGEDFAAAARALAGLGYWLDAFVLDARHFVPQSRPRVFMIGVEDGLEPPGAVRQRPELQVGGPWRANVGSTETLRPRKLARLMEQVELATGWQLLNLPRPPARRKQLADVIDLGDEQEWWGEAEVERHRRMMSDRHARDVERLQATGGLHVGTIFRRVRHGRQRAEVRLDGLAGCLRTPRGGSAKQIVLVVDGGRLRMRWMSPREYARLQGADDFPLSDERIKLYYGFGDAVCVPVIRWIDRHVLTPLFDAARPARRTAGGRQPQPRATP